MLVGVVLVAGVLLYGFIKRIATATWSARSGLCASGAGPSPRVQQRASDRGRSQHRQWSWSASCASAASTSTPPGRTTASFHFVGIAGPDRVVAAVDVAQREAAAQI